MTKEIDTRYTQERELSWLRFNERVLEEAKDESVPLFERLKFAAIFTSNLDEFFMIRVGSISDMTLSKQTHVDSKSGLTPAQQLQAIFKTVPGLYKQRDKIIAQLEKRLRTCNICNLSPNELDGKERKQVERWFRDYVQPVLSPMVVDSHHPFPHLPSNSLTIALTLQMEGRQCFGLVPIPKNLPPYLRLEERGLRYLLTEQVVLAFADTLFENCQVEEKCVISVTRNADISPEDEDYDVGEDFRAHMLKVLKKRSRLAPVRLEMQGEAPALQAMLLRRLRLTAEQSYVCTCPLVLKYAYQLDSLDSALFYPPHAPAYPAWLDREVPMWEQIRQRDVLLFYPYHSMQPFLDLLRQSAADPAVVSIQMTIYRVAGKSAVIKHLCAAAENGKAVTVLVELRARFDEGNNITWARELEEAGCRVIYGPAGYKCHGKICLITRKEKTGLSYVTQIGTGNYNEKTAALYTDFSLLTADRTIAADGVAFFQNMLIGDLQGSYGKLLVAPVSLKQTLLRLIDGEITRGDRGRIILKTNAVTERELIDKLAEASQAGVRVDLIVRGICCLVPGVPGKTDHITVTSIVGEFLEHSRIYCFGEGALRQMYLSSADIMTRNQERRVEIACPVESREVQDFLSDYLARLLGDNVKARRMLPDGGFVRAEQAGAVPVSVQQFYLDHPPQMRATERGKGRGWRLPELFRKRK